jgi:hypothetical protein
MLPGRHLPSTMTLRPRGGNAFRSPWISQRPASSLPSGRALSPSWRACHYPHLMLAGGESRRNSIIQPRDARHALPWVSRTKKTPTLKGLQHLTGTTVAHPKPAAGSNPFRVEYGSGAPPRVARASQPWAERCNPVGIESGHAGSWITASPKGGVGGRGQNGFQINGHG